MELIFVYNAKSGKLNALLDAGHKLLSPKSYPCKLCELTYNTFSENKVWKTFRESHNVEMTFLHSDEFEETYEKANYNYPIILSKTDSTLQPFISSKIINETDSLSGFIKLISEELETTL